MTRSGWGWSGCWPTGGSADGGELRAPVAKSTLSHHLRVLRDAGITRTRQEGTRCFVVLRRDDLETRFPGLLAPVLAAAECDEVGRQVGLASSSRALQG
ncbi:helix-turn-helix domain-containing protein [Microbispora catharanthi]|uniref:ArsR/SmtB family transcription factor n=1 Tax=Microbispora catharanthi TaxID=1712871 RepID=UPI0026B1F9A5